MPLKYHAVHEIHPVSNPMCNLVVFPTQALSCHTQDGLHKTLLYQWSDNVYPNYRYYQSTNLY